VPFLVLDLIASASHVFLRSPLNSLSLDVVSDFSLAGNSTNDRISGTSSSLFVRNPLVDDFTRFEEVLGNIDLEVEVPSVLAASGAIIDLVATGDFLEVSHVRVDCNRLRWVSCRSSLVDLEGFFNEAEGLLVQDLHIGRLGHFNVLIFILASQVCLGKSETTGELLAASGVESCGVICSVGSASELEAVISKEIITALN